MQKITLSPTSPTKTIHLSEENPFFRFKRFCFKSPGDALTFQKKFSKVKLKYLKKVRPQLRSAKSDAEEYLNLPSDEIITNQKNGETCIDWVFNLPVDHDFDKIELILDCNGEDDISLELWYETLEIHPFTTASEGFKRHIEKKGNMKILFSAPFGAGKTTFLREYFKENDDYEVFHLFPVNYSVATNDDIFKYIKVELLFSLLEKDVEFDMESFSKSMTMPFYLAKHAYEVLIPFVQLLPKVGKNIHAIIKDLLKLISDFKAYHATLQIDDQAAAENFINEVYEKEGSIFEDNFFSQLIRQLIEQIQLKPKKTVLILDDLDRIDPEHIFRILNVFAAHIDQQGMPDEMANKFGFDRIILVCHYENLKKIFQHKYGPDTDFSGYIDKYFSQAKFEFDSKEICKTFIIELFKASKPEGVILFATILIAMINDEKLTLRETIKLSFLDLGELSNTRYKVVFLIIDQLCKIMDLDSVIFRFGKMKDSPIRDDKSPLPFWNNYDYMFKFSLVSKLFYPERGEEQSVTYSYNKNGKTVHLKVTNSLYGIFKVDEAVIIEGEEKPPEFKRRDCFVLFEQIALAYKKMNGLKSLEK